MVAVDAGGVTLGGELRKPLRVTAWPLQGPAGRTSEDTLRRIKSEAGVEPVDARYVGQTPSLPDREPIKLSPDPKKFIPPDEGPPRQKYPPKV